MVLMPKKGNQIMDESLSKIRHERSKRDFPGLRLDEGEYVEFFFKRAKVCLYAILGGVFFGLVIILFGFLLVLLGQSMIDDMGRNFMFIILAALLFYRLKLKKPFDLLGEASKRIADNDLDFHIEYDGYDELGRLCSAFETMRSSVQQNNITMWRSIEERKRVNSAFAHDMRTPVTVMKGYADMLQNYMPEQKLSREKEIQTVSKIRNHIGRLEQYIESMSAIQKLEDLEVSPTFIDMSALISEIKESASIICGENGKHFSVDTIENAGAVSIDRNVLLQIYENLVANAVRFSQSEICIELKADANNISLCVRDDGQGFSNEELTNATKPYYKGENTSADMHFGLGLYICNLLCKKHGGACTLSNGENGGAVVTATLKNYS